VFAQYPDNSYRYVVGNGVLLYSDLVEHGAPAPDVSTFITDAPEDGKIYGRQDGEWVEIVQDDDSDFAQLDTPNDFTGLNTFNTTGTPITQNPDYDTDADVIANKLSCHNELVVLGDAVWEPQPEATIDLIKIGSNITNINFQSNGTYTPDVASSTSNFVLQDLYGRQITVRREATVNGGRLTLIAGSDFSANGGISGTVVVWADGPVPAQGWNLKTDWSVSDLFGSDISRVFVLRNEFSVISSGNLVTNTHVVSTTATESLSVIRTNALRANNATVFGSLVIPTPTAGDKSSNAASTYYVQNELNNINTNSINVASSLVALGDVEWVDGQLYPDMTLPIGISISKIDFTAMAAAGTPNFVSGGAYQNIVVVDDLGRQVRITVDSWNNQVWFMPVVPLDNGGLTATVYVYRNGAWASKLSYTMTEIYATSNHATVTQNNFTNYNLGNTPIEFTSATMSTSDASTKLNAARTNRLIVLSSSSFPTQALYDTSSNAANCNFVQNAVDDFAYNYLPTTVASEDSVFDGSNYVITTANTVSLVVSVKAWDSTSVTEIMDYTVSGNTITINNTTLTSGDNLRVVYFSFGP